MKIFARTVAAVWKSGFFFDSVSQGQRLMYVYEWKGVRSHALKRFVGVESRKNGGSCPSNQMCCLMTRGLAVSKRLFSFFAAFGWKRSVAL